MLGKSTAGEKTAGEKTAKEKTLKQQTAKRRRCAVSDFDRTLYVNEEISPENIRAVRRWQERGDWFVIATGRNESGLMEKLSQFDCRPDAYILNNGARILLADGTEVYCRTIEDATSQAVMRYLYENDRDGFGVTLRDRKVNVLSADHTTTQKACDGVITIDQVQELADVVQLHTRRPDDPAWISRLCRDLNERFPGVTAYANVWNADIMAHGVDKEAGIRYLVEYAGGFDQVLTVGDSENDVRMIGEYAGAAMSCACENARQAASRTVESVAEYLNAYLE